MHAGASAEIFRKAKMLRKNMTVPEQILRSYLSKKPLGYKFRRQHPFGIYVLDFYCHSKRISIEIDGLNHNVKSQMLYDNERTKFVTDLGITEMRFNNEDVIHNFRHVEKKITNYLCAASL